MNEPISQPAGETANDLDAITASVKRLSEKILAITDIVNSLVQDRSSLEAKIEDAQSRIQHILSRLPEQTDGRQMNLLGEGAPPSNPEDDNEPTTH
jgi:predicted  nucleic acid-binding Zn-ribbon protein